MARKSKELVVALAALDQMTRDWHAAERRLIALENELDALKAPKVDEPIECWHRPAPIARKAVTAWDQSPRIG